MLKAANSLLLPTPEPGKAKLAAVGREGGAEGYELPSRRGDGGKEQPSQKICYFPPDFSSHKRRSGSQPGFSSGHFPSLVAGADRH